MARILLIPVQWLWKLTLGKLTFGSALTDSSLSSSSDEKGLRDIKGQALGSLEAVAKWRICLAFCRN